MIKTNSTSSSDESSTSCAYLSECSLKYYEKVLTKSSLFKNVLRITILFSLGSMLGFVLNLLQMEYKTNLFPHNVLIFLQTGWFFIPLCGLAAMYIGVSYPFFDQKLGEFPKNDRDWSVTIRSFAFFIGLNHLVAKIHFENSSHFSMILYMFCIVFWYWFDQTKFGLVFNMMNAVSVIIAAHTLRYLGLVNYTKIQFDYLQTCLSCLIFSGGITFGNIGRVLNLNDYNEKRKIHLHSD